MATNEPRYREAEQRLWRSLGLTPTEQRVHLAQVGVNVRIQEVGQGPPVLFVHGGSICGASWAPLVARLAGFRCLLLDRPGCGLSEALPDRLQDVQALGSFAERLLVDVLDAMQIDKAHLVATSFGGYIALRTAAAHPDRAGRMVEFGWTIGAPTAGLPLLMRLASIPAVARLMSAIPPNERAVRMILRSIGLRQALAAGRISQEEINWFLALLRDTNTVRNEVKSNPRIITLRGMNERVVLPQSLLSGIDTPIYFLWGGEDLYGGEQIAREFVQKIPNAQLEIMPGAGHAVWMDDAAHSAEITRKWLNQTTLAG
jgi:2-hydroxy-6-oxonona-2,4-dienedioate hydrolase